MINQITSIPRETIGIEYYNSRMLETGVEELITVAELQPQ